MYTQNAPAWAERVLNKYWEQLSERFGARMAVPSDELKRGKFSFQELGCGHYGCVIKSAEDGIVFKITSDASEAAFVTASLSMKEKSPGVIRYYDIVEIPESHRTRRVFAITREEASLIGFPLRIYKRGEVTDSYMRDAWRELIDNLKKFQKGADKVREYLRRGDTASNIEQVKSHKRFAWDYLRNDSSYKLSGAKAAAVALLECQNLAEIMEHTYASDKIGGALGFYIDKGILLADVHVNNVGVATRPPDNEYDDWHSVNVITDPGHMVPLSEEWLAVEVPQL